MKIHKKKKGKEGFKCDEGVFSCQGMTTLIKHKNTQHPLVCKRVETPEKTLCEVIEEVQCNKYTNEKNESKTCVEFEEELGLYEIELIDGGGVLVCNLCNE